MFSIFKRKYPSKPPDLSGIQVDMHSHLLPGIDDGAPDTEISTILKKGLEDLGYKQFIATPHIMWDMYKNTPVTVNNALNELQQSGEHANMKAAAEYFMDDYFYELLEKDEPLLTVSGKKVLVEFSFVAPPMDLKDQLFKMQIRGYEPILAHPERYTYFAGSNKSFFDEFKSMGCIFQMNILSLTGYYGKIPQELALYLISKDYIDLVGTDLHHHRHLDVLRKGSGVMHAIAPLLDSGRLINSSFSF